jgi:hypothetical protein
MSRGLMFATYVPTPAFDPMVRSDQLYRSPAVGLGDADTTDPNLQAAAGALLAGLQNGTVTAKISPVVANFQQAWLNAGGQLAPTITASSGVDGMYGITAQTDLQLVLNSVYGPGQPAPMAFTQAQLTAANGGGGGGGTQPSGGGKTQPANQPAPPKDYTALWAVGLALLAVGAAGTAVIHKDKIKKGVRKVSKRPLFGRRRRAVRRRRYARA